MVSKVRFFPKWTAEKSIFNAFILILLIWYWVIQWTLAMCYRVVLEPSCKPLLYVHIKPSYGEQSRIFPKMNCSKIYIQCTYPELINQILSHPPNPDHGLHNGTGSTGVGPFWAELWQAKANFSLNLITPLSCWSHSLHATTAGHEQHVCQIPIPNVHPLKQLLPGQNYPS